MLYSNGKEIVKIAQEMEGEFYTEAMTSRNIDLIEDIRNSLNDATWKEIARVLISEYNDLMEEGYTDLEFNDYIVVQRTAQTIVENKAEVLAIDDDSLVETFNDIVFKYG